MTKLLIVESPAKAKTIAGYLGPGWQVRASYGHIRDLPSKEMGIDPERGFAMTYVPLESKTKVISSLREAAAAADEIYLATDLDREGEAIAWHVAELLHLSDTQRQRVTFTEITKTAILDAIQHPRQIDMPIVDAQQSRRGIDRLVGYTLSPLLSNWLNGRLSAGRVQSAGLKVIVDRERIILDFNSQKFWTIKIDVSKLGDKDASFRAALTQINGKKLEKLSFTDKSDIAPIITALDAATYHVENVAQDEARKNPPAPFTTSTLQQEASRKLGFSAKKTMDTAQGLYQGISIDNENVGLITYMRTDSVTLSEDAVEELTTYIEQNLTQPYHLNSPRTYQTRTKGAQEAHEAIRPSSILRTPELIGDSLDKEQLKLYTLIWQRTLATQVAAAVYDTMSIDVQGTAHDDVYGFKANGRALKFEGFLTIYEEDSDEDPNATNDEEDRLFPVVATGEKLEKLKVLSLEGKTKPLARFTEASFVKEMEKLGIGRPSTYASIIDVLKNRSYIEVKRKKLVPTELGTLVTEVLEQHFPDIVDAQFTAGMESELDEVADGALDWVTLLRKFWTPFIATVDERKDNVDAKTLLGTVERPCPLCNKELIIRFGKKGKFLSCSGYPDCKYTADPNAERSTDMCPACGEAHLVERVSKKKAKFWSCERYPECTYIRSSDAMITDRICPQCDKGRVLERKSKTGGVFYVCEMRPVCDWLEDPSVVTTDEACPKCSAGHLIQREGKYGSYLYCSQRRSETSCTYLRGTEDKLIDEKCPECGGRLVVKTGKNGSYTACEMRPTCKYIKQDFLEESCPQCKKGRLIRRDGQYGAYIHCEHRPECKYLRSESDAILDEICPECGGRLVVKTGKNGKYTTCEMRPTCKYIKQDTQDEKCPLCKEAYLVRKEGQYGAYFHCSRRPDCKYLRGESDVITDESCPDCGGRLVVKTGKKGPYTTCEMRPSCSYIKGSKTSTSTGIKCPECKTGELFERSGSKGPFWGCGNYPKCKFTVDHRPMPNVCTSCGGLVVATPTQAECSKCKKPA